MEPSGLLLASSTPDRLTQKTGNEVRLIPADQSPNLLIRSVANYLSQQYQSLSGIESGQFNLVLDGQRQYLQIVRFDSQQGLDWIVVLVLPESDFMERIYYNRRITILLCGIALLVAIFLGLLTTQWLSKPLLQLSESAQGIAKGEWKDVSKVEGSGAIGELSRSFTTMTQQLKMSFKTLEKRVEERTLEIIQLNQELQGLANIDGLTQTENRRYFDHYLKEEWQRLAREQAPLTLLLCDVDHFKQYNDAYGHVAGDRCLQNIAQVLKSCVQPPADVVARYGGEEFAIVLPKTELMGAIHLAQQILKAVRDLQIPHAKIPQDKIPQDNGDSQGVTISIGVATVVPVLTDHPQSLVVQADRALYAAKDRGRDCYCVAQRSISEQLETMW